MKDRIAIVSGARTPFCKAMGAMRDFEPDDLGAYAVTELIIRSQISPLLVDELIFGNVIQPPKLANIARIIAVKAGLSIQTPAFTVNRNCASGLEAITTAADKINLGRIDVAIAGGTESMSNFPISIKKSFRNFLQQLSKARGWEQKISTLASFRLNFLIPEMIEILDPLCGLTMGQTAELLAREFVITRQEQDQFALMSQQRAYEAINEGYFANEVIAVPLPPKHSTMQTQDDGPRAHQTIEALSKLKPAFDPFMGTVTAGNSSQVTDGAAALLLMKESKAKELKLTPLGYIRDYAVAGLAPARMGLGPVFATAKLLKQTKMKLADIDLIEINEAFAAQVLACLKAFSSNEFARKELGWDHAVGEIPLDKLNVNGGAIALGHPLGASGARLVITLLNELKRRNKQTGLAALCIGGGQGQAIIVEVN